MAHESRILQMQSFVCSSLSVGGPLRDCPGHLWQHVQSRLQEPRWILSTAHWCGSLSWCLVKELAYSLLVFALHDPTSCNMLHLTWLKVWWTKIWAEGLMPTIAQVQEHLSSLTRDIEKGQQKYLPDTACLRLQHFGAIPSDQICIAISLAITWARCSDVYSAVTFNSRHRVLFMLENASVASEKLQRHLIVPEGQTYYTSGLEGIELCATQLIWAALIPWSCGFLWVSYSHSTWKQWAACSQGREGWTL